MTRYYRKVIRIKAEDSPNVRKALAQQAEGLTPTGETILPGVLPWADYQKRRATWDRVRQCVGLDAEFWEGADSLLFPPEWLNRAETLAGRLAGQRRTARAIGVDPAEGGDSTTMAAVDDLGLIELASKKTPDTSVITGEIRAFMRAHNVPAEKVFIDRGGGGKQHADRLREQGYAVQTVAFGEAVTPEIRRGHTPLSDRREAREERTVYKNRRAELYGTLRELLDPGLNPKGFAIPAAYSELRRQLSPIPLTYDDEGRLVLLPKNRKSPGSTEKTLTELLGCSPDEADAVALACYGLRQRVTKVRAGAV